MNTYPHVGLNIADCYMQGIGELCDICSPGIVEAVGKDWCVVRVTDSNKAIFVISRDYDLIHELNEITEISMDSSEGKDESALAIIERKGDQDWIQSIGRHDRSNTLEISGILPSGKDFGNTVRVQDLPVNKRKVATHVCRTKSFNKPSEMGGFYFICDIWGTRVNL